MNRFIDFSKCRMVSLFLQSSSIAFHFEAGVHNNLIVKFYDFFLNFKFVQFTLPHNKALLFDCIEIAQTY